jgi:hypothetical protein
VTEVVAPAPQHRVDPAQQVGERSMTMPTGERSDLVDDRRERLLRRVGVDRLFAVFSSSRATLDAPAVSDQGNPSSGIIENRHGVGVLAGGW